MLTCTDILTFLVFALTVKTEIPPSSSAAIKVLPVSSVSRMILEGKYTNN